MTDDPKTGDKTVTERNIGALQARVIVLESLNVTLIAERDEAVKQLKEANDLIEGDTKARLVTEALEETTMTLNELAGMDILTLENVISISKLSKGRQHFESGADLAPKTGKDKLDARTYLHNLYVGNKKG